jgi:hypothetical protein
MIPPLDAGNRLGANSPPELLAAAQSAPASSTNANVTASPPVAGPIQPERPIDLPVSPPGPNRAQRALQHAMSQRASSQDAGILTSTQLDEGTETSAIISTLPVRRSSFAAQMEAARTALRSIPRARSLPAVITGNRNPLVELAGTRERKVSYRPILLDWECAMPSAIILSQLIYWYSRQVVYRQRRQEDNGVSVRERIVGTVRTRGRLKQTDEELGHAVGLTFQQVRDALNSPLKISFG